MTVANLAHVFCNSLTSFEVRWSKFKVTRSTLRIPGFEFLSTSRLTTVLLYNTNLSCFISRRNEDILFRLPKNQLTT